MMKTKVEKSMPATDLDTALTICHTLEGVINDGFGPCGSKTMLTSATGKVLVTSDGATIFEALSLAHPVARLIVKTASKNSQITGGGCKTFVMYLSGAMEAVRHLSRKYSNERRVMLHQFILQQSDCLQKFLNETLSHGLHSYLKQHITLNSETMKEIAFNILNTELSSHYTPRMRKYFANMLMGIIVDGCTSLADVSKSAKLVDENFQDLCIKINNKPYTASNISKGVLLRKDFTVAPAKTNQNPVKFILLRCSVDEEDMVESGHKCVINSPQILSKSIVHKQQKADSFMKLCNLYGIKLILSTEKVFASLTHICRKNNIAVVEYIPETDADRLSKLCNVLPVYRSTSLHLDNICEALSVNSVSYGGVSFIEINVSCISDRLGVLRKQIIVCAPGDGLCDQAGLTVHKAIKYLSQALTTICSAKQISPTEDVHYSVSNGKSCENNFDESVTYSSEMLTNTEWDLVQGGGTFELLVDKYLNDIITRTTDKDIIMTCQVVRGAVSKVPQALFRVAHPNSERSFLRVYTEGLRCVTSGSIVGINCYTGDVSELQDVLEPLGTKIATLMKALQLVCQILRLDSVVSVKSLSHLENTS